MYLDILKSKMNNGMIKIITGLRRCGKSFLLFKLFYDYLRSIGIPDSQIICITLDDEGFFECRKPEILYKYIKDRITKKNKQYFVFIDEAQYAISKKEMKNHDTPLGLYDVLNSMLHYENVDTYVTGSNSKFLSTDVLTEFRGRGDEIHIAPLSFSEFLGAYEGDKYEAWREYSLFGGLPHIMQEKSETAKSNYLKRLNTEIYIRDIVERYNLKDSEAMETLMKVLASSIGSLANAQKIADTFVSKGQKGITMPTISSYLNKLQESFVIQKAERYDIKGRKYISTPSKYYYSDLGLRNALLNFRQYEETHIMENIIYNELIYRGFNVDVGLVEVVQRENNCRVYKQLEVDFVANLGSKRYYIQSAYAIPDRKKMEQEQASLVRIPDSFKKIIVVYGHSPLWRNEQGITIMSIFDFLINSNSLDL